MKTKITAFFLAAAILFSFAACGKTDTSTTTIATVTVQTTLSETNTATAATTTEPETAQPQSDARTEAETTAATTKATTQATTTTPAVKTFTKAELAQFDGKNGKDAYIAYDGIVYNVTGNSSWKDGNHHNFLYAGNDLTTKVNGCIKHLKSFMVEQFNTYPKVGTYSG